MATLTAQITALAAQVTALQAAVAALQVAATPPTDLTPVLAAIAALNNAVSADFAQLVPSVASVQSQVNAVLTQVSD